MESHSHSSSQVRAKPKIGHVNQGSANFSLKGQTFNLFSHIGQKAKLKLFCRYLYLKLQKHP